MKIKKIHIENFRSMHNASIKFGRVTVFIGKNNSGKNITLYK